jgi:hypothetical protein
VQAYVQQKHPGSSFVCGYLSGVPAYFYVSRLTVIDTQSLRWRGFDAHFTRPSRANVFSVFTVPGLYLSFENHIK